MVLLTKGALKKRFQTPLDLNLLLFWLSRACQWAIRLTLDSHILITLDFFNTLLCAWSRVKYVFSFSRL